MIQLANVLPPEQLKALKELLSGPEARFQSGKATAGWAARDVKHNEQAGGSAVQKAIEEVKVVLLANAIFQSAARPKEFVKLLASRYQAGMSYGTHVDDALMGGRRTDLSFTLFLSDPASYDGGELIVEAADGETDVKLPAGSLVLYQTTNLHRVAEVTRGERLAIVGWVRSFIRSPEQRDVLFEMDQVVAHLKGSHAPRENMNQALRARNMLMRMWAED